MSSPKRLKSSEEQQLDAEHEYAKRQLKAKEAEKAFYDNELKNMREERNQVKDMASEIMATISRFERENSTLIMSDVTGPYKMDQYISKFNANSKTAYQELTELASSFKTMRDSIGDVDATASSVMKNADSAPSSSAETKIETYRDDAGAHNGMNSSDPLDAETLNASTTLALKIKSAATTKLAHIFSKGQKEYNSLVMSMASVDGDEEVTEQMAIVPTLNRKILALTHSLQMSQLKADAVQVQWVTDKEKFLAETKKMQKSIEIMDIKLQVATGRSRFNEAVERDPNMVRNVVSVAEYDALKLMLEDKDREMMRVLADSKEVTASFAALKTRVYEAERSQAEDKARIQGFDKEISAVRRDKEALEKAVLAAEEAAAAKHKDLLHELEQQREQMLSIKNAAKEESQALKESLASLEKTVVSYEKAEQSGGGPALLQGLMALKKRLGSFQQEMITQDENMLKLLEVQTQRLDTIAHNSLRLKSATRSGGSNFARPEDLLIELESLRRERLKWEEEKNQFQLEAQGGGVRAGGKRSHTSSPTGSPKSKSRSSSPGREDIFGLADGEMNPEDLAIVITDVELETVLDEAMNSSGRNSPSRQGKRNKSNMKSYEFGDQSKKQMRQDLLKKLRVFSNKLVDGMDPELIEENEEDAKEKVQGLLRTYSNNIMETIDSVSDHVNGLYPNNENKRENEEDDDEDSVVSRLSNGSGFKDEWGDFTKRPMTAEEQKELEKLKQLLQSGELGTDLGTVRKENFSRLRGKNFGNEQIIELTMMEHYTRYDAHEDGLRLEDLPAAAASQNNNSILQDRQKQNMQLKMMSMLKQDLQKQAQEMFSFAELAAFKTNTERDMQLLRSFSALKAIKFYSEGGNFLDVLSTNRDVIDNLITLKGGWRAAMEEVKTNTVTADTVASTATDHWPEFFRIKVLQYHKELLQNDKNDFQKRIDEMKSIYEARLLEEQKKLDLEINLRKTAELDLEALKAAKKKPVRANMFMGTTQGIAAGLEQDAPGTGSDSPDISLSVPGPEAAAPTDLSLKAEQMAPSSPIAPGTPTLPSTPTVPNIPLHSGKVPPLSAAPSFSSLSDDRLIEEGDIVEAVDKAKLVRQKTGKVLERLNSLTQLKRAESDFKRAAEIAAAKVTEENGADSGDEGDNSVVRKPYKARKLTAAEILASRLHPSGDQVVVRVVKGEHNAIAMAEFIVHSIESWQDQYFADAIEPLTEALSVCKGDPQLNLVHDFMDLLDMALFPPPREVLEVLHKFEAILQCLDEHIHEENKIVSKANVALNNDSDDVSELGHSDDEEPHLEDATDMDKELPLKHVEVTATLAPSAISMDVDVSETLDSFGDVPTASPLSKNKKALGQSSQSENFEIQEEKRKLAKALSDFRLEKEMWEQSQSATMERHRTFDDEMQRFEMECDEKRSELMHIERQIQAREADLEKGLEDLSRETAKQRNEIEKRGIFLEEEKTRLETLRSELEEDRALLLKEQLQLVDEKKDLEKEWEDFFASESKTREELLYEDIKGPTQAYLKKQDEIDKKTSHSLASDKKSVAEKASEPVEKIVDARSLLPKGMTFNDAIKAQLKDLDNKEEVLAKRQKDFMDSVREEKQRMQKEKLANFKTKSDLAKQMNEMRKERKSLDVKLESLKREETLLQEAKASFQALKTREEIKMHDIRDKTNAFLKLAEERAHKAAEALKHAKDNVQQAVAAAVSASSGMQSIDQDESSRSRSPSASPKITSRKRSKQMSAESVPQLPDAVDDSAGVRAPRKISLLKKSATFSAMDAQTSSLKDSSPEIALKPRTLASNEVGNEMNNASEKMSEVLAASHITAKLALRRKAKAAAKLAEEDMQRKIDERVEAIVKERVFEAIQLSQVDLVDCGTQTVNFAASMSPDSRQSTGRSTAQSTGVTVSSNSNMKNGSVPELSLVSNIATSESGLLDNVDFIEGDKLLEISSATHPLSPPPVLPPGFYLVHCKEQELEICPGVTYASFERLPPGLLEKVPPHVLYVFRGEGEAYTKGIKRLPQYVARPKIGMEGTECVVIPQTGFEIAHGVRLIIGSKLQAHLELPLDVHVAAIERGAKLPPGMSRVDLDACVNVYQSLVKKLPKGVEMVQTNFALNLPVGTFICEGVEIVKGPRSTPPLPPNLHFIKRHRGADMPSFLTPILQVNKQDSDIYVNAKIAEGCTIMRRPFGLVLGSGQELLHRAPGHPLPPGMSIVPLSQYPEVLRANKFRNSQYQMLKNRGLELIQLTPRIDLPETCCFEGCWFVYPTPVGMRLAAGVGLYRYEGAHGHGSAGLLPSYLRPVPMPDIPYGVALPPTVLAAEWLWDSNCYLPPGTHLLPGLTVLSPDNLRPLEVHENPKSKKEPSDRPSKGVLSVQQIVCERAEGCVGLPQLVAKGSTGDLPAGVLLAQNMELVTLRVRYELPAGVKIEPGARLGPAAHFAPGTILHDELEVLELPYGAYLEPGQELVKFLREGSTQLPPGFEQVLYTQSELELRHLDSASVIVSIPKLLKLHSNQELGEAVTLLTMEDEIRRRHLNYEVMRSKGMFNATTKNPFGDLLERIKTDDGDLCDDSFSKVPLPAGCVLVRRDKKSSQLPFGMSVLPKNYQPVELRRFLANNPGGNTSPQWDEENKDRIRRGLMPRKLQSVEVIQLAPTYQLPVGTELVRGLVVLQKPTWLLPACQFQWLEMVSETALLNCDNSDAWMDRRVELRMENIPHDVRTEMRRIKQQACSRSDMATASDDQDNTSNSESINSVIGTATESNIEHALLSRNRSGASDKENVGLVEGELNKGRDELYLLPAGCVLISIPKYFQVHSWGSAFSDIQAVVQHAPVKEQNRFVGSKSITGGMHVSTEVTQFSAANVVGVIGTSQSSSASRKKTKAPVHDRPHYMLPTAHFFIQRKTKAQLPSGFCLGLHPKFASMQYMFGDLPPGVEIMHLQPTYHLPLGISVSSANALRALIVTSIVDAAEDNSRSRTQSMAAVKSDNGISESADNESAGIKTLASAGSVSAIVANPVAKLYHTSIHGIPLCACPQFGFGQQIGPGVRVLPHPPGWLSRDNQFLYRSEPSSAETSACNRTHRSLIFVSVRIGASGLLAQLPPGARVHECSDQAVSRYFDDLRSQSQIDPGELGAATDSDVSKLNWTHEKSDIIGVSSISRGSDGCTIHLIELPQTLPSSRALLKDGRPIEAAINSSARNERETDKEFILVHAQLRNPSERDPPPPPPPEEIVETIVTATSVENLDSPVEGPVLHLPRLNDKMEPVLNEQGVAIVDEFPPEAVPSQLPIVEEISIEADVKDGGEDEPEEEAPLPRAEDLLASLELAQEEIYMLENENNKLLTELKDIKSDRTRKIRRLAMYAFRQQTRDKGFLSLRNEISEKAGEIVKYQSMLQMKNTEARKLVADKFELRDRMQAQIDVLNKQLAHSIDANEVVRKERRNMEADFAVRAKVQNELMSRLYSTMKTQSRQFMHVVLGHMFLMIETIMKNAASSSISMNEAVTSLYELTERTRAYNISAVQNAANKKDPNVILEDFHKRRALAEDSSNNSVSSSLSASLAPSVANSVAPSVSSTHSQGGSLRSFQSKIAHPMLDPRAKVKDSWNYAQQEKKIQQSLQKNAALASDPFPLELMVASLTDESRYPYRPLGEEYFAVPPSPDAYIIDHDNVPLSTAPATSSKTIPIGEWASEVGGFLFDSAAHPSIDDDISVLSEESSVANNMSKKSSAAAAKIPRRFQGQSVPSQLASIDFSSPQRAAWSEVSIGSKGKERRRHDLSSIVSTSTPSVATPVSQVSATTPIRRDAAQQSIIEQSKAELAASREYIGVAAKMALRQPLPVGGKGVQSNQLLRPLVVNRTPQGDPLLLSAKEAGEPSRRNNNFARVPSPIVDKRMHPGSNLLKSQGAVNLSSADSLLNLSAQPAQQLQTTLVPINPFLPVVNDVPSVVPPAMHTKDFGEIMEAFDKAMNSARVQGVHSINQVLPSFELAASQPEPRSGSVARSYSPFTDEIALTSEADHQTASRPSSRSGSVPPELSGPSWEMSPLTQSQRKKVPANGSPASNAQSRSIHGFLPEEAHAPTAVAEVVARSTRELFESLMKQLQDDNGLPLPSVFLQPYPTESTAVGSSENTNQHLNSIRPENPLLAQAHDALQAWRTKIEGKLLEHTFTEKQRYLTALYCAEAEMNYLVQLRQSQDLRVTQMEDVVNELFQKQAPSEDNASARAEHVATSMREFELLKRVSDLERNVTRLRKAAPFKNTIDFMRKQSEDAASLRLAEQALKFQSLTCQQRAKRESSRIALGSDKNGGEVVSEAERKAVTHLIKALKAQAKLYNERAQGAKAAFDSIMKDVLSDVEAYENAILTVLPQKSLMSLLRWSTEKLRGDPSGVFMSAVSHVHNPQNQQEQQFRQYVESSVSVNPYGEHSDELEERIDDTEKTTVSDNQPLDKS